MGDNPFARKGGNAGASLYDEDDAEPSGGGYQLPQAGAWGAPGAPGPAAAAPPPGLGTASADVTREKKGLFGLGRKDKGGGGNPSPQETYAYHGGDAAGPAAGAFGAGSFGAAANAGPGPGPGPGGDAELGEREKRLNERERALAEREQRVAHLESRVRDLERMEKNWPVCCKVVHHDIPQDIPAEARGMVRLVYASFLGFVGVMSYNVVAVTVATVVTQGTLLEDWLVACLLFLGGLPGAALLWYLRLYNAAMRDRNVSFIWFFAMYVVHIGFCVLAAIAPPLDGPAFYFAGFLSGNRIFQSGYEDWLGIMYMIGGCLWILESAACVYGLGVALRFWRGSGQLAAQRSQQQVQLQTMTALATMNQGGRGGGFGPGGFGGGGGPPQQGGYGFGGGQR